MVWAWIFREVDSQSQGFAVLIHVIICFEEIEKNKPSSVRLLLHTISLDMHQTLRCIKGEMLWLRPPSVIWFCRKHAFADINI